MTTAISRSIPPQRPINFVNPVVRAVLQSPLHGAVDNALLLLHIIAARPATTTTSPWDTAKRTLRLPQESCCRGSRTGGQITQLKHGAPGNGPIAGADYPSDQRRGVQRPGCGRSPSGGTAPYDSAESPEGWSFGTRIRGRPQGRTGEFRHVTTSRPDASGTRGNCRH